MLYFHSLTELCGSVAGQSLRLVETALFGLMLVYMVGTRVLYG